ncbi:hypothetical protein ZWY2020_004409 [Hordeum vulgare]|nr:hypothetical protein ZWY2020_004409 [Hordeum vulgare]
MPALGLRSPSMGPLVELVPVRALSSAAGSRLISHRSAGKKQVHSASVRDESSDGIDLASLEKEVEAAEKYWQSDKSNS